MSSAGTFAHVTIKILEKEYNVACPLEEKASLLASAELLNGKMREIRDSGKVVGLDRVAVMAALNIANELLKAQGQDAELKNIVGLRIRAMREHLDSALGPAKQLTLYSASVLPAVFDADEGLSDPKSCLRGSVLSVMVCKSGLTGKP